MIKKVFLLLALCEAFTFASVPCDEDEPCTTFDGFKGIGKAAKDCEFTRRLGKSVKKHSCLRTGAPLVCCPLNKPRRDEIINPVNATNEPHRDEIISRINDGAAETACKSFPPKHPNFSSTFKILFGTDADLAEFPHFASIGFPSEDGSSVNFECGGVLISNKFVLSAAHCFSQVNRQPTVVRLGKVKLILNAYESNCD